MKPAVIYYNSQRLNRRQIVKVQELLPINIRIKYSTE
jgi:hypothetical protein